MFTLAEHHAHETDGGEQIMRRELERRCVSERCAIEVCCELPEHAAQDKCVGPLPRERFGLGDELRGNLKAGVEQRCVRKAKAGFVVFRIVFQCFPKLRFRCGGVSAA